METKKQIYLARKLLKLQNKQFGPTMQLIPREQWGDEAEEDTPKTIKEVWRSRDYCAQIHDDAGIFRISACRTAIDSEGRWLDGITWDELQRIKNEIGFAEREAVEIYPPKSDEVTIANMRHLWLLPEGERLPFSWKQEPTQEITE